MKNNDELYKKYYDVYKNDDDIGDKLNEAKKKKFDYRQFELFHKTDEKSKLDKETKKIFKEIENREKGVDKKKLIKYFIYEPTALVKQLKSQTIQDLRKSFDEIKQQKIELNKDERNSRNNKNENDRLNMILSVIRIYQLFEYKFLPREQPDESKLPKWVKVIKKRFDMIKNKVQDAKNNKLQARPNRGRLVTFHESNKLLHDIKHGQINHEEALKKMTNIRGDIKRFDNLNSYNQNQAQVLNTLFMVDEIFPGKLKTLKENNESNLQLFEKTSDKERKESDEQLGTTDMPGL